MTDEDPIRQLDSRRELPTTVIVWRVGTLLVVLLLLAAINLAWLGIIICLALAGYVLHWDAQRANVRPIPEKPNSHDVSSEGSATSDAVQQLGNRSTNGTLTAWGGRGMFGVVQVGRT